MKYFLAFLFLVSVQAEEEKTGAWITPAEVGSGDGGFTVYYNQAECDKTSDAPCLELPEGYNPYFYIVKNGKIEVDDERRKNLEARQTEMATKAKQTIDQRLECKNKASSGDLTGDALQECLALIL